VWSLNRPAAWRAALGEKPFPGRAAGSPRRRFAPQAQAALKRVKDALAPPRSYGQRPESPKAHRRDGYLTTAQIKPVNFSLFRCTSAKLLFSYGDSAATPRAKLAGKPTELQRLGPRAPFAPGVSWHATRVFFRFNLTYSFYFFQIRRYGRDIDILYFLPNDKAGKVLPA
jgi:hypothetical protein